MSEQSDIESSNERPQAEPSQTAMFKALGAVKAESLKGEHPANRPKTVPGAEHPDAHTIPISIAAMLVTIGVVYGDIGTSPMYVTKALLAGQGGIGVVNEEFVLGALSLVIWTVSLLTTVKYVLV